MRQCGNEAMEQWSNGAMYLLSQPVSDPRLADDVTRPGDVGLDLLSQLADQHPEVFRLIDGVRSPDRLEDDAMREDAAGMPGQQGQQVELFRREANLFVLSNDPSPIEVDDEIAGRHLPGLGVLRFERAAKRGADARE